jgi:hypothetical protein
MLFNQRIQTEIVIRHGKTIFWRKSMKKLKEAIFLIFVASVGGIITLFFWEFYKSYHTNIKLIHLITLLSILINVFFIIFIFKYNILLNYLENRRLNKFKNELLKMKSNDFIDNYKYLLWFPAKKTVRDGRYAFPFEQGLLGFDAREIPNIYKLISCGIIKVIPDNVDKPKYYDLWLDIDIYNKASSALLKINESDKYIYSCNHLSDFFR